MLRLILRPGDSDLVIYVKWGRITDKISTYANNKKHSHFTSLGSISFAPVRAQGRNLLYMFSERSSTLKTHALHTLASKHTFLNLVGF